jgi:hypothetical protein
VRAALIEQDAADFDRQWREAKTRAMDSLDLAEVTEVLASWRRVARATASMGAEGYREMLARTERTLRTGERAPSRPSGRDQGPARSVEPVSYLLDFDQIAQDQIAALPHDAAVALADVWTFLQLTP